MSNRGPELGVILRQRGAITDEQLRHALSEQEGTRERIGEILSRHGHVSASDVIDALSTQLDLPRFDPTRDAVEPSALDLVPLPFAERHDLVPVRLDDRALVVAISDPLNLEALDHLGRIAARVDREVRLMLAPRDVLERVRKSSYGWVQSNENVSRLIDKAVDEVAVPETGNGADEREAERRAQEAGIVNLVDEIIARALQERATDIHVEPHEGELVIRYRLDGMLYDALKPPRAVYTGAIARLKILANMDIAERRTAQDGRFSHRRNGCDVDVRVSAIPTIHGEKLVLRLLDKSGFNFSLRDIGFSEDDYLAFQAAIRHPYGMVLLSGPTGSGKTTTLYASLLELRNETTNITTVEDPVEYQMVRINQVQVNERKNVTFANALRSFLRQDPDVIMVGEIRDRDTAEIAVRAALTGHMVLSTIHANDAPATATRLISMGVEPFMAASAFTLVAAQRLVRRCCRHCLEEYRPDEEMLLALGGEALIDGAGDARFLRGAGCVACKGRGYAGRVAIVERMMLSRGLRHLIATNAPAGSIRDLALEEGMKTLWQSGLEKVRAGTTTVEEVLRVCVDPE